MSVEGPVQEQQLEAGDGVVIKAGEFDELEKQGTEPVMLYQVEQPATQVQFLGR